MTMTKLQLLAVTGVGCVALLGASYLVPATPAAPAPAPEPNAGAGNGTAPVDRVEFVGVAGTEVKYPNKIESKVGDKQVKLALTGAALRKKVIVNVYTVASYAEEGVALTGADDLCGKDCVKQLHLVMTTSVSGKQMADAFTDAVRQNHPKPAFDTEVTALNQKLRALDLAKGDQVWLTNVPGKGLQIDVVGKMSVAIETPAFAKAMWEVYLGKKNIGEGIKTGLVSQLK